MLNLLQSFYTQTFISSFEKEIVSGIATAEVKEVKMIIRPSEFRGNLSLFLELLCKSSVG